VLVVAVVEAAVEAAVLLLGSQQTDLASY